MFEAIRRAVGAISLPLGTEDAEEGGNSLDKSEAQLEDDERAGRFSVGSYYAPIEFPSYREELHLELAQQGYELFEPPQGGGGGLLVTRGKVVIDASGAGAGGTDDNDRSYGYGHGSLNLGYIVARSRWFGIYPLLGVGVAIQLSQARGIAPRPFLRAITGSSLHV